MAPKTFKNWTSAAFSTALRTTAGCALIALTGCGSHAASTVSTAKSQTTAQGAVDAGSICSVGASLSAYYDNVTAINFASEARIKFMTEQAKKVNPAAAEHFAAAIAAVDASINLPLKTASESYQSRVTEGTATVLAAIVELNKALSGFPMELGNEINDERDLTLDLSQLLTADEKTQFAPSALNPETMKYRLHRSAPDAGEPNPRSPFLFGMNLDELTFLTQQTLLMQHKKYSQKRLQELLAAVDQTGNGAFAQAAELAALASQQPDLDTDQTLDNLARYRDAFRLWLQGAQSTGLCASGQ